MKETVEKYIEAYNAFHIDEMLSLFTDDCEFENFSNASGSIKCNGKNELFELALKGKEFFKTRRQAVTNWVIGNDQIAIEISYEAALVNGETLKLKGVSFYEFNNGKIKRLIDYL